MIFGVVAGFGASFTHPADPTSGGAAFAHDVLRGDFDLSNPDKGA